MFAGNFRQAIGRSAIDTRIIESARREEGLNLPPLIVREAAGIVIVAIRARILTFDLRLAIRCENKRDRS